MDKPEGKTLISMRFPTALLERVDEEAIARRRSRAFVITEYVEKAYAVTTNGNSKPAAKTRKKATV